MSILGRLILHVEGQRVPVRPPSLRAIAAFEAAARHGSFTRAADELNLTQSAVSHAIRTLEERLGVDLFERFGRRVVLTDAGSGFVSRLQLSLSLIAEAFEAPARGGRSHLVIGAPAWLIETVAGPAVSVFRNDHPECDIDIRTALTAADVAGGSADLGLVLGASPISGLAHRGLGGEVLFPVAAPGLADLRRPEDLVRARVIAQPDHPWRLWLETVGLSDLPVPSSLTVDSAPAALGLARQGEGVCLTLGRLARADLEAGRLVRLFNAQARLTAEYAVVWNPASPRAALARSFVDCLERSLAAAVPDLRSAA